MTIPLLRRRAATRTFTQPLVTRPLVSRPLVSLLLVSALAAVAVPAQADASVMRAGDMRRIEWLRPWAKATAAAKAAGKVLIVKPILGGSNTPDPDGVPCGGKKDCEGSW